MTEKIKTDDKVIDTPVVEKKEEKGISKEVVEKMLEKVRKEEKDKVYANLDKVKKEVSKKEKEIAERVKEVEKLENDLKIKTDESLSEREILEKSFSDKFKEQSGNIKELESTLIGMKKAIDDKELELYRDKLIYNTEDGIIEALVIGKNKEELDNSLVKAKKEYKIISDRILNKAKEMKSKIPTVANVSVDTDEKEKLNLNDMTTDEWEKERKNVLEKLKQKFNQRRGD